MHNNIAVICTVKKNFYNIFYILLIRQVIRLANNVLSGLMSRLIIKKKKRMDFYIEFIQVHG